MSVFPKSALWVRLLGGGVRNTHVTHVSDKSASSIQRHWKSCASIGDSFLHVGILLIVLAPGPVIFCYAGFDANLTKVGNRTDG